jgi:hypothetical protein
VPQWSWEKGACASWPQLFSPAGNTARIFVIELTRFLLPLRPADYPASKGLNERPSHLSGIP